MAADMADIDTQMEEAPGVDGDSAVPGPDHDQQHPEQPTPSPLAILSTNPPPDALPDGWIAHKSRTQPGYVFYFNQFTGENRWDLPFAAVSNLEGIKETIENLANLAKKETEQQEKEKQQQQKQKEEARSILRKSNSHGTDDASVSSHAHAHAHTEHQHKKRSRGSDERHAKKRSKSEPEKVRVLHILKKHNKSRRPASWRMPKITISKEEAIGELQELISILDECKEDAKELRATFEELAKTESDCSSAKRGGDVGFFGRRKMQPEFELASFGLAIGEMSGIVSTNSGVHVILRLG